MPRPSVTPMPLRLTAQAVPEGAVRSRAWFNASGRAGTVSGELLRSFGHFKTFPVQVMMLHIGEIQREFQAGNAGRAAGQATGLFVSTALAGALINELLEISNFKEPRITAYLAAGEVPGFDYWMKDVLKGGGLGIYGDLMLAMPLMASRRSGGGRCKRSKK
jgi:hypothetical protein